MASIRYVGDVDVLNPFTGDVVAHGDVIDVFDAQVGGLVGYGDGVWQLAEPDAKPAKKSTPDPVPADAPVDPAPAEENNA